MNKKYFVSFFFIVVFILSFFDQAFADRQSDLEANFDYVSTFDELSDWSATCYGDCFESNEGTSPDLVSGGKSRWNYWSYWTHEFTDAEILAQSWIGLHGSDYNGVANQLGTKSLALSVESPGKLKAPSRLGMYIGSGNVSDGYTDVYVFYRLKINANQWPTDTSTDPDSWVSGDPYAYFFSWKHFNIGTGFTADNYWNGTKLGYAYGDKETLVHFKAKNIGGEQKIIGRLETQTVTETTWFPEMSAAGVGITTDEWIGVEYHYVLESPAYAQNGRFEAWLYSPDGTATKVATIENVRYKSEGNDTHAINRFVWGGNNSNSYTWGNTMDSIFYIDDVIIDKQRIGPKYYTILGSHPSGDIVKSPTNLRKE